MDITNMDIVLVDNSYEYIAPSIGFYMITTLGERYIQHRMRDLN